MTHRANLIGCARDRWYDSGPGDDPGPTADVPEFVREVSAAVLAAETDARDRVR